MPKRRLARIFRGTPRNLQRLAHALAAGELVAVPTETVYGLAANAFDGEACRRIFQAKRRPATDPLIVHLHDPKQLSAVCVPNESALKLAAKFWPGPLTIVLPKLPGVPAVVTAGRDSVAVRVPAHRLFRRLLKEVNLPLAAPSANPFGYISPTTAEHVRQSLGQRIKYILDGGPCEIGLESTIIDLRDPQAPRLLRPGAVTTEQLSAILGQPVTPARSRPAYDRAQLAPGMLTKHYSPRTAVRLHQGLDLSACAKTRHEAYVLFAKPATRTPPNVFWFDARGDLRRAARNVFALLRRLDRSDYRLIHVERAPSGGLGDAINDRLQRAAAK